MHNFKKAIVVFFIVGICAIQKPLVLNAADFESKLKSKLSTTRNVQYGTDQGRSYQGDKNEIVGQEQVICNKKDALLDYSASSSINSPVSSIVSEESVYARSDVGNVIPISSYAIYKADYKSEIEDNVATIKGNVLFEVFKKGWTQLPLVSSSVGLIDASVNKGASFVIMQGGRYYLMIDKPGRYTLEIEFLIKAARERENGPGNFSFEAMPAPISQFEFMMPETGVDIFVEPAIKVEVKKETNKTMAWAVMPNTNTITVRWTKALPKETIAPVKLEPKLYADTSTYGSLGEGLIRCSSTVDYSILQAEVSNLRVALPDDVSVLEVQGNDLRDWKISKENNLQYLDVYLNFGVKGRYSLSLTYERKIGEGSGVATVPEIQAVGVEREKGFVGLAAATNVELAVNKAEHVTLIDVKELPSSIWRSTTNPILLAFKYLNPPYSIAIDVTKHEELPVLVAAIDSADYMTLQTEEGKVLTKATYQIRNNVKQFIHLTLPKTATLWSVFVAGKPVKPAKDKDDNILIPLEKSQLQGETLTQFPVEIVYLDKLAKMGFLGGLKLRLPQTDIPASILNWLLYLPLDYSYFNFRGDVKRGSARGAGYGGWVGGYAGMKEAKLDKQMIVSGAQMSQQFSPAYSMAETQTQSVVRGVLPIKIDVPEQGRLYRFSKILVAEKESPWLSVNFIRIAKQVWNLFRLFVVAVAAIWLIRRRAKKTTLTNV